MVHEVESLVSAFEKGQLSRRALVTRLLAATGAIAGLSVGEARANRQDAEKTDRQTGPMFPSKGLNHLALNVTDVARSRDWYQKHLGLKVLRDGTRNCFMRTDDDFLALFQSAKPGLNHFCFTWPGKTADEAVKRLRAAGRKHHREENRVYFDDPDGLTVQVAEENDWGSW